MSRQSEPDSDGVPGENLLRRDIEGSGPEVNTPAEQSGLTCEEMRETLLETHLYVSIQGRTKNNPGPLAPPERSRPSRNMTALSYSCTT